MNKPIHVRSPYRAFKAESRTEHVFSSEHFSISIHATRGITGDDVILDGRVSIVQNSLSVERGKLNVPLDPPALSTASVDRPKGQVWAGNIHELNELVQLLNYAVSQARVTPPAQR